MVSVSQTESQAFTALRSFLLGVLPDGTPVVQGQSNRVSEPKNTDFLVMWSLFRNRLAMNIDDFTDVLMYGAISGNVLNITHVSYGTLEVGRQIFGVGILPNTIVTRLGTGLGGIGTYTINNAQIFAAGVIAAGYKSAIQETQITIQCDVHGPNSADNAQIISTLLRDEYGTDAFEGTGVSPLYTDDPKQITFINGEMQYEDRWIVDAVLQVNPSVNVPQQFADVLTVIPINVDAAFPPQ